MGGVGPDQEGIPMTIQERRVDRMVGNVAPILDWVFTRMQEQRRMGSDAADFTFGNPQEMPLPGLVDALQRNAVPHDKDWFAYKLNEEEPTQVVADSLRRRTGIAFEPQDVAMTAGAFGALAVTIRAMCDEGDEVIFLSPPWFFYELMILSSGATPVRVRLASPDFGLDTEAVAAAITPRTRAIIVNSPHNPTGRIYRQPELAALGQVLEAASERNGRPIVLLSDESYNRIVFDDIEYRSPALDYGATITIYTYGKTLLAPGQRIGYAAMSRRSLTDARPASGSWSSSSLRAGAFPTRCCSTPSATSRRCRSTSVRYRHAATGW